MSNEQILEQLRKAREPKPKKIYKGIARKSAKTIAKEKAEKEKGSDSEMDLFFASMRKSMTGHCLFCNGDTMKRDNDKFHFSLAHLLPKATFRSIATVPDNIVELCFYGNSCHTNFDSGKITWQFLKDSKEWDILKERLLNVLPLVAQEERKNKLYSLLEKLVYSTSNI